MDEEELTPWQKENLEYMRNQGAEPIWDLRKAKAPEEPEDEEIEEKEEKIFNDPEPEPEVQSYESFADRLPNIKKVRNKRLIRRLILIVTISAIAILTLMYFVSPLSKLEGISVSGNENTNTEALITGSQLKKDESLWEQYMNREVYERNIQKRLPRIKKASISLNGINSFKISVTEYEVVALESKDSLYYPILENGRVLDEGLKSPKSGIPVFENFSDEKMIKSMMDSYNDMSDELKAQISEIKYAPSNANKELVNLYMKDNNRVIVNISQLAEKMKYYPQIASQMSEPGVVDMEVGIYSYSDKKDEESSTSENGEDAGQYIDENQ